MKRRLSLLSSLVLAWFVVAPASARAQESAAPETCALCGIVDAGISSTQAAGEKPLTISIESSVDFDRVLLTGTEGARVRLSPQGERTEIHGVQVLGARAFAGKVVIRGEPNRPVVIDLPHQLDLISAAGTQVRIEEIRSDAPLNPTLDSTGILVVNFGGDLVVDGDTDGDFRGNLRVDVNYL